MKMAHRWSSWITQSSMRVCSRRAAGARQFSKSSLEALRWNGAQVGIEYAHTPPSSWYTDPLTFHEVEAKVNFRSNWLCAAGVHQLGEVGNYVAGNIVGEPYVIVKSQSDDTLAFYNVCRHHAAQICDEGSGHISNAAASLPGYAGHHKQSSSAPRFVCPYHGWEYLLDGRLAKAVHMKGCKNFRAADNGLLPIQIDRMGPWLFLNLAESKDAARSEEKKSLFDSQPDMKEFHELLSSTGYESLVHVAHRKYHLKCNWKVFIDNYLDGGYHVPVAHPGLASALDMKKYRRVGYDNFYLQACGGDDTKVDQRVMGSTPKGADVSSGNGDTGSTEDAIAAGGRKNEALYLFHYPNLCVNRYGDWMDTNIVWPLSPAECVVEFDWYATPEIASDSGYVQQCLVDSDQVQREDVWLCERVQKGLQSSAYGEGGRYAPQLEGGEFMFHQRLQNDLETALQRIIK